VRRGTYDIASGFLDHGREEGCCNVSRSRSVARTFVQEHRGKVHGVHWDIYERLTGKERDVMTYIVSWHNRWQVGLQLAQSPEPYL
jgi:hypothetical protein